MRRAVFELAELKGAIATGTNLHFARLMGADICRANFSYAIGLPTIDQFLSFGDGATVLPIGMKRPPVWPKIALDEAEHQTELDKFRVALLNNRLPSN